MNQSDAHEHITAIVRCYRVHILVFFLVFFVGITFSHPELLLNDEQITVNQLHQLHDGHQVIINEGKYGLYKDGTVSEYFAARGNLLGYSLFLPLISIPAYWLVDIFGEHSIFLLLYLWTFIPLVFVFYVHLFYQDYSYIGKWRWTPSAFIVIFILFFLNLLFYFPVTIYGSDPYPEILAVVFTNILLISIAAALVYELCITLFTDPLLSFFGTVACLTSSSCFFWVSGCKDHILTMVLFTGILFCIVKLHKTGEQWDLPLAFLLTGLLAWARPELALWVCFALCVLWIYSAFRNFNEKLWKQPVVFLLSPAFTLIGALPFFLNNYLVMKNPLVPPGAIYLSAKYSGLASPTASVLQQGSSIQGSSINQIITMKNTVPSANIPADLFGIFFHPMNGSMGVFMLTPLFLVMGIVAGALLLTRRISFTRDELHMIAIISFLALPVILAYSNDLPGLNYSIGITPDIRYLLPVYIPLTLIGLVIARKIPVVTDNLPAIMKTIPVICLVGIPISLYMTATAYADQAVADQLDVPLSNAFTLAILLLAILAVISIVISYYGRRHDALCAFLIASLCALPFIWQITISVRFWLFGATNIGFAAWIPVTRVLYDVMSSPLFVH